MNTQEQLNFMCPAGKNALLGDKMVAIIAACNDLLSAMATDTTGAKDQFDGLVETVNANFDNVADLITAINTHFGNFNLLKKMLMSACLGNAALAMSAGTNDQVKSVNAIDYLINGKIYTMAETDPLGAWTAGHTGLGNSQEAYYLLCLDSSGVLSTVEGAIVAAGAGCVLPAIPSNVCAIGALKIVTGVAGIFVPDTTPLNDAGITVDYINLGMAFEGDSLADDAGDYTDAGEESTAEFPEVTAEAVDAID